MDYVARTSQQLAAILKSRRAQRGLTQSSAGQRVGLGQKTVSNIETDAERSSTATLFKLLSALELELVIRDKQSVAKAPAGKKATW